MRNQIIKTHRMQSLQKQRQRIPRKKMRVFLLGTYKSQVTRSNENKADPFLFQETDPNSRKKSNDIWEAFTSEKETSKIFSTQKITKKQTKRNSI